MQQQPGKNDVVLLVQRWHGDTGEAGLSCLESQPQERHVTSEILQPYFPKIACQPPAMGSQRDLIACAAVWGIIPSWMIQVPMMQQAPHTN